MLEKPIWFRIKKISRSSGRVLSILKSICGEECRIFKEMEMETKDFLEKANCFPVGLD